MEVSIENLMSMFDRNDIPGTLARIEELETRVGTEKLREAYVSILAASVIDKEGTRALLLRNMRK